MHGLIQYHKEESLVIIMKNQKIVKIIYALVIIISILSIHTKVFGVTDIKYEITTVDYTGLDPSRYTDALTVDGEDDLKTIGNSIATVVRNVGVVLAVIILMVLGIKYMLGSVEERAEYKKTMIPYLIGAVLIFAASAIAGMVVTVFDF